MLQAAQTHTNRIITALALGLLALLMLATPDVHAAVNGPYAIPNARIADEAERYNNGDRVGQCLFFVKNIAIKNAGADLGGFGEQTSVYQEKWDEHAAEVSLGEAQRGDVVQWGGSAGGTLPAHTATITKSAGSEGTTSIIDSNVPDGSLKVGRTTLAARNPSGGKYRIWRVGQVADPPTATVGGAAFTLDGLGRVWIAAITSDGSLYYKHTASGPNGWDDLTLVGEAGVWSPQSSPALTVDGTGRVWIAAVRRNGSLYYKRTVSGPNGWGDLTLVGDAASWSPQSSPALTVDGTGAVWIAAVKASGSLYYKHTASGPNGWDDLTLVGEAGVWSPQSSPALTVDGTGRVWIAAVRRNGSLYYKRTVSGPNGWGDLTLVGDAASWSPQSSPALTVDGTGAVWIAAVKASGSLYYKHTASGPNGWDDLTLVGEAGVWSPQSSPALTVDGTGRVWIAAVRRNGSLYYKRTVSGPNGWGDLTLVGDAASWSPQSSPALTVDGTGAVWIAAVKASGSLYYKHTSSGPNGWNGFNRLW